MTGEAARCGSCGQGVFWSTVHASGNPIPLEPEAFPIPVLRMAAHNADTGHCKIITLKDLESNAPARWARNARVTFHRTHFATCPHAMQHRRRRRAQPGPDDTQDQLLAG